jgi:hypothetical protein
MNPNKPALASFVVRWAPWLTVFALLLAEWSLFVHYARREYAWVYPFRCDQAFYLTQSYNFYDDAHHQGFFQAVENAFSRDTPQGVLFGLQGGLLFSVFGASRMKALAINFLYFALLQVAAFSTLRWLTSRWSMAFLGLGMLLLLHVPFMPFGAIVDYRIDFTAFCLYGIVLCLVIRSGIFESWRWSLLVGAVAGWMILYRFFTGAYVFGAFSLVFCFLVGRWLTTGRANEEIRSRTQRQLLGWLISVASLCAMALPVLWLKREQIYNYYVVGHLTGAEKEIRAMYTHISTALDSLLFYPKVLATEHLGVTFLIAAGVFLGIAVLLRIFYLRRLPRIDKMQLDLSGSIVFLFGAFLTPYLLLTFDISKSNIVANILVPSVFWLLMMGMIMISRALSTDLPSPFAKWTLAVTAVVAVTAGLGFQHHEYHQRSMFREHKLNYQQVGVLYDVMADYLAKHHQNAPTVSFNCMEADFLNPVVVLPYVFERQRMMVHPQSGVMGSTIFEISEADALKSLATSDLVIVANPWKYPDFQSYYPFDACMKKLYPKVHAYCEQSMKCLAHIQVFQYDIQMYGRP